MKNQVIEIATLIGDPVRVGVMWALMDGRALTATELAIRTDTSPQNISNHLSKLVLADLLAVESQGRHRYYRFAKPEAAFLIEALAALAPQEKLQHTMSDAQSGIRYCRTCYDHLAGRVGVVITDRLLKERIITVKGTNYEVTAKGNRWFDVLGISVADVKRQKRSFARQCLDWSERRHHLSGALGAALLNRMLTQNWMRKLKDSRGVQITATGQEKLYELLGLNL